MPYAIPEDVLSLIAEWEESLRNLDPLTLETLADQFAARGFAVFPQLSTEVGSLVAEELNRLVQERGVRREFTMEQTGHTPRRMTNVRQDAIQSDSQLVPFLYQSVALREVLSRVAREPVHLCPYEPERFVITHLETGGDTHGWHWDDYAFALVWVAHAPPIDDGGFVQCVPRTAWDKDNPRLYRQMASSVIHTIELRSHDVYFMRTDTTLHRVAPVERGHRTIVNMGFASTENLATPINHETMDRLWAAKDDA